MDRVSISERTVCCSRCRESSACNTAPTMRSIVCGVSNALLSIASIVLWSSSMWTSISDLQAHEAGTQFEERELPQALVRDLEQLYRDLARRALQLRTVELDREPACEGPDVVRDVAGVHEDDDPVLALHLAFAEV